MNKNTHHDKRDTHTHQKRRDFLKQGATAAAGLGFLSLGLRAEPLTNLLPSPLQDSPGTHNMLVVGEQTVFLSHLPMFDGLNKKRTDFTSRHRYQVILEATFTDGANNLTETYLSDRRSHATEKMYSINPALFVLPDLNPAGKALRSFRGNTVYRGHLERENTPIIGFMESGNPPAGGVFDVNVTRAVHFHKFTPGASRPPQLQYILFGKGDETFLAHFIAAPGDFDQVIGVKITGEQFTDEELARGIKISFPGKLNSARTRLREAQKSTGVFELVRPVPIQPGTTPSGSKAKRAEFEVIREFYFEEGELRIPPTFNPTAEERKSGFA